MDRVDRIDGEKFHLNRLTDEELDNMRGFALTRVHEAQGDVDRLEQEIALRRPVGEIALSDAGWTMAGDYVPQIERTPLAQQAFEQSRIDL